MAMKLTSARFTAATLAALACACSTVRATAPQPAAGPRRSVAEYPRFPAEVVQGPLVARASLYTDHERVFGVDLTRTEHVLPIALHIGFASGKSGSAHFDPDAAALRLYLPDGTILTSVAARTIHAASRKVRERLAQHSYTAHALVDALTEREGCVYFAVEPTSELHFVGDLLLHKRGAVVHPLDLSRALVGFEVQVDGRPLAVQVGVDLVDSHTKE